jgi:hypothetical protein
MCRLAFYFDTPSSFEGAPWAFARNAAGHAAIVGALPAVLFPAWAPLFLVLYAAWEAAQWHLRRAEAWDCLHDWSFVCAGALAVSAPILALPLTTFLAAGVLRRASSPKE